MVAEATYDACIFAPSARVVSALLAMAVCSVLILFGLAAFTVFVAVASV